jgi:serine/threonine protein kinase
VAPDRVRRLRPQSRRSTTVSRPSAGAATGSGFGSSAIRASSISRRASPVSCKGKEADARSDVWAFGAVLYEMVTGMKAFRGKSYEPRGRDTRGGPSPMSVQQFTPG